MSFQRRTRVFAALASIAALAWAAPAQADSTWNLGTCTNQQTANKDTYGNSYVCAGTNSGGNVTISAFGGADATASTGYQQAYLAQYGSASGFGVASKYETIGVGSPNHSMDNDPTTSVAPDMILLKFDNLVSLNTIVAGWSQSDADLTVMAYTGSDDPTIIGKKANIVASPNDATNLTKAGSGWSFVQNVGDKDAANATGYAASNTDITYNSSNGGLNAGATKSSWWLISAYSAGFGGGAMDTVLDYVKLLSVAGTVSPKPDIKVPEPASIALVATAMLLLGLSRRRSAGRSKR